MYTALCHMGDFFQFLPSGREGKKRRKGGKEERKEGKKRRKIDKEEKEAK